MKTVCKSSTDSAHSFRQEFRKPRDVIWSTVFGAFLTWGSECGARDQSLDHKLRKSKELYDIVEGLLGQLQEFLDDGLQILQSDDAETTRILQTETGSARSRLGPMEEIDPNDSKVISDGGSLSGGSDGFPLEEATSVFEVIENTVDSLRDLAPSLARPYPDNLDTRSSRLSTSSDKTDQADVELARKLFPSASQILQARLGHANWKRKLAQRASQLRNTDGVMGAKKFDKKENKRAARLEVAQDPFNFQRPYLGDILISTADFDFSQPTAAVSAHFSSEPSDKASDTTPSIAASVFSSNLSVVESAISSLTVSTRPLSPKRPRTRLSRDSITSSTVQPLMVVYPKVPVQLESGRVEMFTCNLCGFDLEAGTEIKTEDDWKQHVLKDLEPYLCTFDECISAREMYAIRDEWYKHELQTHRIQKVWVCVACTEEFGTKGLAEDHIQTHAGDEFDEDQISMMKAMLRQGLSKKQLGTTPCPLCFNGVSSRETKAHISDHLEAFALMSIIDTSSDEDDSDDIISMTDDDAMSDRGRRETIIKAFVNEQLNLNTERGTKPPDRDIEGGNDLELLDDLSENDESASDMGSRAGRRQTANNPLMDRMLGNSQDNLKGAGRDPKGSRKVSWPAEEARSPSHWSSSNKELPWLRTSSWPRNDSFIGRDRDLANLYKILYEPGRVCILHGEYGTGKTDLAIEFSWRYEHAFHYVFWVSAETPVGSVETFIQIALQLGLKTEGNDNNSLVRAGREFIETTDKRWLLVFDNASTWAEIDDYMPTKSSATNGSMLITTRNESFTAPSRPVNYYRITLPDLDMEDGRKLLINILPNDLKPKEHSLRDPEYKIAGDIAALAGIPFLIIMIAGYVKQADCSLAEFWEYWEEWRPQTRADGGDRGQEAIFQIRFRDLSADARKILRIMAFLESDSILPEMLVRKDNSKPGPSYLRQNRFRTLISNLIAQKFITDRQSETDGKLKYNIHRMLQTRLLQDMHEHRQERDEIFQVTCELVRYHLPRPLAGHIDPQHRDAVKEYLPHVLSLYSVYSGSSSFNTSTPGPYVGLARLFKDGGVHLWQRASHDDALKLFRTAEKILDDLRVDETELRMEINIAINSLVQYFGMSHRLEAKERSKRVLEMRENEFDRLPPEQRTKDRELQLQEAYADHANNGLAFNDYTWAEPIYLNCMKRFSELGATEDTDPWVFAKLNHHMAFCAMYRRDFAEAEALAEKAEKAVALIERTSEKQLTLRYQFDQACIILQSGDLIKALMLHREILQQRLSLQGRANYFSLQSQYAYGAMCHYSGQYDEAIQWLRQALIKADAKGSKNFWPEAAIARTKYHLAEIIKEKNGNKHTPASQGLANAAKDVLSKALPYDPNPIVGVKEEDTLALFDHLQPVFGGRWTGRALLRYVSPVGDKK